MRTLSELWTRLCRRGVAEGMDERIAKRLILTNQLALTLPAIVVLFMPFQAMQGMHRSILAGAIVSAAYLLVPWLHRCDWPSFSRIFFIGAGNATILVQCLIMGGGSDMHIFFCTSTWMGLALFAPSERKSLLFSAALPSVLMIGFLTFDYFAGGWNPQTGAMTRDIRLTNLIAFQVVQVVSVLYFYLANHRTETALAKAGEAAQAADRAKSRFLANMSHEIRTPLNGILGLSGNLLAEPATPRQRETLLGVHSSAHDLLRLVNDLLDISRIEAGMLRLEPAPFRLRALAESVLAPFRLEAERKGLALGVRIADDAPDALWADSIRLKQVLNNLLGNAFKFTDQGGVELRIRAAAPGGRDSGPSQGMSAEAAAFRKLLEGAAPQISPDLSRGADAPDRWLREAPAAPESPAQPRPAGPSVRLLFEVEDTGIGIPDSARTGVFRPFTQVDGSTTRRHEGAGLGLFIARQIVEGMGGSIGFRSGPAMGSVFHFTAEFPLAGETAGSAAPADPAGEGALPHDLPVLIVEDHVLNRKVISGMLEARGLSADEAEDGNEALEALRRKAYRLILTDLHMPGMDGLELTRRVRALQGIPAPVIVGVTADAMAETRLLCVAGGMDDVLTKPILARDLDALLSRLSGVVGQGGQGAREKSASGAARPD